MRAGACTSSAGTHMCISAYCTQRSIDCAANLEQGVVAEGAADGPPCGRERRAGHGHGCPRPGRARLHSGYNAILVAGPALSTAASATWYAIVAADMLPAAACHSSLRDADPEWKAPQWRSIVILLSEELRLAFSALLARNCRFVRHDYHLVLTFSSRIM